MCEDETCEIIRGEMCEGRNVPLDLRGAKSVWGETWDIHLMVLVILLKMTF